MLYNLLFQFHNQVPVLNVIQYITFRTAAASLTALVISLLLGPWLIRKLREFQIGQMIRDEGPASHEPKAGTPTMGGLLILTASLVPTLLWADLRKVYIWIAVLATAAVARWVSSTTTSRSCDARTTAFCRDTSWSGRWVSRCWWVTLSTWPVQAAAVVHHAVDLSVLQVADSRPRLAVHPVHRLRAGRDVERGEPHRRSRRAGDRHVRDCGRGVHRARLRHGAPRARQLPPPRTLLAGGELTIFCGSLVGASLGFLWYNSYPAEIFMGDVGSLALGGAFGTVAILIKQELLLPLVGGVFVIETLSVIIQVASFKLRGKRVFKMAPLHHHFELIGWSEPKVITRFLIAAIIFALFSLTTLKLR